MNLCIDRGNTRTKAAIFDGDKLIYEYANHPLRFQQIKAWIKKYGIRNAIISSVKDYPKSWDKLFSSLDHFFILNHTTKLPFKNEYGSPETLGVDRIALLSAAGVFFKNEDCLVIGAGTCITLNYITKEGVFTGGSIHPGLQMRFWAMHTYTGRLPLIKFNGTTPLMGNTTQNAMLSGVIHGAACELDGMISEYKVKNPKLKVLIAGGDAQIFETMLKNKIFAVHNLVLVGLNKILNNNVQ
jgi:type III pantothenate kinase